MKIGFKNKKRINFFNISNILGDYWNNNYGAFFIIVVIIVLGIGAYFWYESLYQSAWSEQEREAYKNTKDIGINFKEADFSNALGIVESRKAGYVQEQGSLKDIFKKY